MVCGAYTRVKVWTGRALDFVYLCAEHDSHESSAVAVLVNPNLMDIPCLCSRYREEMMRTNEGARPSNDFDIRIALKDVRKDESEVKASWSFIIVPICGYSCHRV